MPPDIPNGTPLDIDSHSHMDVYKVKIFIKK